MPASNMTTITGYEVDSGTKVFSYSQPARDDKGNINRPSPNDIYSTLVRDYVVIGVRAHSTEERWDIDVRVQSR